MADFAVQTLDEPAWVRTFLEFLAGAITPHDFFGPLSCRMYPYQGNSADDPEFVLLVFPTPFEVRYGAEDGAISSPGFTLDVQRVLSGFSSVKSMAWHVPVVYNGNLDGPELRISGTFVGIRVWLRIFTIPPSTEQPSHVYEPQTGRFWERG